MDNVKAEAMVRYLKEKVLRNPNITLEVNTPLRHLD